ncbi:uncharacterized protein LOC113319469 isoform X1 [Papaver somniferum]|nr:uncharacterized protein LOC113319469 isoform X1 [Papaver somniferum]
MGIPNPKAGGGGGIVNDSPSNTIKRHQTDPSPLSFFEGERILAYHDPLIYEAKVVTVEIKNPYDNTKEYLIHYKGWNKKWDEWVGVERLLKFTEENKKLQEELKLAQQHIEKNPKSGCLSNMNPESFTDAKMDQEDTRIYARKGKRQTSDFRVKEELKLEQQDTEKDLKSGCLSNMKSESSADAKMDQDDTRKYVGKGKKRRSDLSVEDELKLVQLRMEKNPNSGCSSNMNPKSSTDAKMDQVDTRMAGSTTTSSIEYRREYVGKGKKRTSDFSVEKQRRYDAAYENVKPLGFLNKKVIRTKIDSLLKVYGGDEGWAFIEEASYKLLIECLLECQEQLDLVVKEEENQGILFPEEEKVQETDEQLLRKNSRRKIPRLSSVAGISSAVVKYEPRGSEPRTEEVKERIEAIKCSCYLLPAAKKQRLQETLGNGNRKLVSAEVQKLQENLSGSVLGTSQRRRKRPPFGYIDSMEDCEEDYVFFNTKL